MSMLAPGAFARSLQRWSKLSIAHRTAVTAVAMTLTFTFVTGLLSFAVTWIVIQRSVDERLEMDASWESRRLERIIDEAVGDLARLSQNSLIANALVDSQGREQYVVPFFQDLPLGDRSSSVTLCDFRGRPIASNRPGCPDYAAAPWLQGVVDGGRPHAEIFAGDGEERLLVAFPVIYPSTGLPEGVLVGDAALGATVTARAPAPRDSIAWRIVDRGGRTVAASDPAIRWPDMLTRARPLRFSAPLDGAGLVLEAGLPRSRAVAPLVLLAVGYLVAAAVLVLAALVLSRALAACVVRPLRALGDAADAITAAGAFGMTAPVDGPEEAARLGAAFNAMLLRLHDATDTRYAIQVAQTREAEGALRSAHEAMQQVTEPIAILDRAGTFTYANQAACRLGSPGGDGLVGARFWDFDPGKSPAWWEQLWADMARAGSVLVHCSLLRDGRAVELEASFTAFRRDGRAYCVATARDVTDRARAERVGRLASLGTLAAGVAHEINNPLAYVTSNVEYVAREIRATAARPDALEHVDEALEDCREGLRRVGEIVRSLKRFSSPAQPDQRRVNVQGELEFAMALVGNELRHRARVEMQLGDVPDVMAPGHELGQVFMNLLLNAAQAIPEGRSTSNEVRVSSNLNAHGEVVVEVRDSGGGIPADIRGRIFEPFFTTKPVGVGTGLGLSICHGIVTQLGGRIEVESEVGRGSTFRVVLPAAASAPDEACPLPEKRHHACTVLVVDDEAFVGRALARMMRGEARIVAVASAREAMSLIARGERFDAILCDLMMPDVTGMQFFAEIRARDATAAQRVGFITGGAFTPAARQFLDGIGNPVLEKPFDRDGVREILAKLAGADAVRITDDEPLDGVAPDEPETSSRSRALALLG